LVFFKLNVAKPDLISRRTFSPLKFSCQQEEAWRCRAG
jgi:hypothetical protein